jgi:hypothetical protein
MVEASSTISQAGAAIQAVGDVALRVIPPVLVAITIGDGVYRIGNATVNDIKNSKGFAQTGSDFYNQLGNLEGNLAIHAGIFSLSQPELLPLAGGLAIGALAAKGISALFSLFTHSDNVDDETKNHPTYEEQLRATKFAQNARYGNLAVQIATGRVRMSDIPPKIRKAISDELWTEDGKAFEQIVKQNASG